MTLEELSREIGARLLIRGRETGSKITRVYAGNRMSDLLEHAAADTLLVTNLANPHLFRIAELMDVPGICLPDGASLEPDLLEAASKSGTAVLSSTLGMWETCRRLDRCLQVGSET